jgi:tetratricopeptide (TPR) repeat protein
VHLVVILAACAVLHADGVNGQPAVTLTNLVNRPLTLRSGIGSAHDTVSTSSKQAQAFYDQGLAYLHSFVWLEAARSFNQALRDDPQLAMAHLGLTIAYSELNAPAAAGRALAQAKALAASASDHDRRHIAARSLQAEVEAGPGGTERLAEYRALLDAGLKAFPQDEELWLLRGLAESPDPANRGQGSTAESIRFYEQARALAPGHFAAHHYLTHAYENSGRIAQALAEGAAYAKMAPAVPHARHMHAHNLRRTGKIAEAIEEFRAADALETGYFKAESIPAEFDWHYQHNLDLLATSHQYLGQMTTAEALLRKTFVIRSSLVVQEFNKRAWPEFLIARGRAAEALESANVLAAHRTPLVSAIGHIEAGRAQLALGQFKAAADESNAALRLMRGAPDGAGLAATPLKALQGEFFLRTGKREQGRPLLEQAAKEWRAAPGPDAWTQALFALEAIARAAREVGDWEFAEWAAKQMVDHDPQYAGSHHALAVVAEHRGDTKTAAAERALMEQYWSNADKDLAELKKP